MATSKTVSSVSNSNKPDTNKESISHLIFYSFSNDKVDLDYENYLISDNGDVNDIVKQVHENWHNDIEIEKIVVMPFYKSQLKRIKQTLELV